MTIMRVYQSAVIVMFIYSGCVQSATEGGTCLSNRNCPSNQFCDGLKCINPCGDENTCVVSNHIPVCSCPDCGCEGGDCRNGEKKFRIFHDRLNWFGALLNCSSQGLSLATIDNQQDQDKLADQMKREFPQDDTEWLLWLGCSDLHKEGQFIWYSTGESFSYKNFGPGEPNNVNHNGVGEHCVLMVSGAHRNYTWVDVPCTWYAPFACEYFE